MEYHKPNTQLNHNFDLEDWEITDLFKDTILVEFIDEVPDGGKVSKGGIHIPETVNKLKDFYRIAQVLKVGPDCTDCIKVGGFLLVPPTAGVKGINKGPNKLPTAFLQEERVMAVIVPKTEEAVEDKKRSF